MKISTKLWMSAIALASLVACGGGGSSSNNNPGGGANGTLPGNAPAPSAAATAVLANSQAEANALGAEAKAGLASAAQASQASTMSFGVETSSLPSGVVTDMSSQMCSAGTASYDVTGMGAAGPAAGMVSSFTFGNCALKGVTGYSYNGGFTVTYNRYVSPNDFSFIAVFKNFAVSSPVFNGSYTGGVSCDYKGAATNAATACYYTDGSRAFSGTFSYTGGKATGIYTGNYGSSGVVKVNFTNFGAAGGTATITGANGYSAVVTYNSATSYTVAITVNGTTTTYTVSV